MPRARDSAAQFDPTDRGATRNSRRPSTHSAVTAALLCLLGSRVSLSQPKPEETFSEKLIVRERTVYIDDSALPSMGSVLRRSPSDFLVRIDGALAELANTREGDPPDVAHLVWLDTDLVSRSSISSAANALSTAFLSIPDRESFSIVETGAQTSSIQTNISRTDLVVRLRQLMSDPAMRTVSAPSIERRISALSRLAVEISRYGARDLGALWLIAEPWPLEPAELHAILRTDSDETLIRSALGAVQRTSRIVASSGWVIFPVSARNAGLPLNPDLRSNESGSSKPADTGGSPRDDKPNPGFLSFILSGRKAPSRISARSLELATEIRLAPMAALARASSGALAGDPQRVSQLAERLRDRRRLVVRDATPIDEGVHTLDVVWPAGDGRAVPALPWVSSLTPVELGVARLLTLVDSTRPRVGAPLRIHSLGAVEQAQEELCFAYPGVRDGLRLSWWRAADRKIELGELVKLAEQDAPCVALPITVKPSDFVQLEALESQEWGAGQYSAILRNQQVVAPAQETPKTGEADGE